MRRRGHVVELLAPLLLALAAAGRAAARRPNAPAVPAPRPRTAAAGRPPGPPRYGRRRRHRRAATAAAATAARAAADDRHRRGHRDRRTRPGPPGRPGRRARRDRRAVRPGPPGPAGHHARVRAGRHHAWVRAAGPPGPARAGSGRPPGCRRAAGRAAGAARCRRHRRGCCRCAGRAAGRRGPAGPVAKPARARRGGAGRGRGGAAPAALAAGAAVGRRRDGHRGRGGRLDRRGGHCAASAASRRGLLGRRLLRRCGRRGGGVRERLAQLAGDGCLNGRGRRLHVLAHLGELGENFLAADSELFRERGYAGLACHVTPSRGPGGYPHGPVMAVDVLIAGASSSAHRSSTPAGSAVRRCGTEGRDVLADRRRVHRLGHAQCPTEGPPPLRELDARRVGVQPRTSSGRATTWIGDDGQPAGAQTGRLPRHDDAEQLGGHRPLPASDAGPDRAPEHRARLGRADSDAAVGPAATESLLLALGRVARSAPAPAAVAAAAAGTSRVAVDVDPPAGQPGRQPGVLALAPDGERELEVGHDDPHRRRRRIDDSTATARARARARCRRRWRGRRPSR